MRDLQKRLLPEGTDFIDFWAPVSADSPVGRQARNLQYEVHEGGDGDEVMIVPEAFIANRNQSFILLVQEEGR